MLPLNVRNLRAIHQPCYDCYHRTDSVRNMKAIKNRAKYKDMASGY